MEDGYHKPRSSGGYQRRALLVANPKASRVQELLESVQEDLIAGGVVCEIARPEDPEALRHCIRAARQDRDLVVLAGGDGTFNRALSALLGDGAPVALIPLGTANDLARTLDLPQDAREAVQVALSGRVAWIDVGQVNDHYFFNVAHIGVGARGQRNLTTARKRRWRALSYPVSLFQAARRFRPFRVRIDTDQTGRWLWAVHVGVGNGRYYGGGIPIDETAGIRDAKLDVYCVRAAGFLGLLRACVTVWRGTGRHQSVWRSSGMRVRVVTRRPRSVLADGEWLTRTPADFRVLPRAVPMLVPTEEHDDVA